jgi:hypothetical protein
LIAGLLQRPWPESINLQQPRQIPFSLAVVRASSAMKGSL